MTFAPLQELEVQEPLELSDSETSSKVTWECDAGMTRRRRRGHDAETGGVFFEGFVIDDAHVSEIMLG